MGTESPTWSKWIFHAHAVEHHATLQIVAEYARAASQRGGQHDGRVQEACRLGSPICSHAQGDSDCGYAVCESITTGAVWFVHITACAADMR